jgi:molybdate transport system permease protein
MKIISPILLTIEISILASVIAFVFGVGIAYWRRQARHSWLDAIFFLPLVLPPSVIGFLLLVGFGSFQNMLPLLFTPLAAIIAASVVAFPLVYQSARGGFRSIPTDFLEAGQTEGASPWQLFWYIAMPLAKQSLMSAFILGFARSIGEFGATMMVAGNIPGSTQTLATAIYTAVELQRYEEAWMFAGVSVGLSIVLLFLVQRRVTE